MAFHGSRGGPRGRGSGFGSSRGRGGASRGRGGASRGRGGPRGRGGFRGGRGKPVFDSARVAQQKEEYVLLANSKT